MWETIPVTSKAKIIDDAKAVMVAPIFVKAGRID